MAISPKNVFPGKVDVSDLVNFPEGKAQDITSPSDGTGTPWVAALLNDVFGFQQAILKESAIIPSGSNENANNSQYLEGLKAIVVPNATTTERGKVELATDAEAITGTDTARALTPANLAATFGQFTPDTQLMSFQMPGGLILQFGRHVVPANTTANITLDIPYPNQHLGAIGSYASTTDNNIDGGAATVWAESVTEVGLINGDNLQQPIGWISWGH